jgi:hypothetical protein
MLRSSCTDIRMPVPLDQRRSGYQSNVRSRQGVQGQIAVFYGETYSTLQILAVALLPIGGIPVLGASPLGERPKTLINCSIRGEKTVTDPEGRTGDYDGARESENFATIARGSHRSRESELRNGSD